jgi:hypothetical protein
LTGELVLTSSLIAAIVTFVLTQFATWQKNAKQSRALLRGIQIEISHASTCAKAYLSESIDADGELKPWAPAYRVATEFMRDGVLQVAANTHLTAIEVEQIHNLYVASGAANRCLALLEALNSRRPSILEMTAYETWSTDIFCETDRCRMKFGDLTALIDPARAATVAALERLAWFEAS